VHLAYFDDSGSEPSSNLCVFGAVVIPGDFFGVAEYWSKLVLQSLGVAESFQEFKAGELYFANGAFQGLDRNECRDAFALLVTVLTEFHLPFIYSAVDRSKLQDEPLFKSSHPVDVGFRMCLDQLDEWARGQVKPKKYSRIPKNMCVVIADECDGLLRKQMLTTFRKKRVRRPRPIEPGEKQEQLEHIHDSMYFGDSVDSIGLQIADACNWSMGRILRGMPLDPVVAMRVKDAAICSKPEPAWATHRRLFVSHEDDVQPV